MRVEKERPCRNSVASHVMSHAIGEMPEFLSRIGLQIYSQGPRRHVDVVPLFGAEKCGLENLWCLTLSISVQASLDLASAQVSSVSRKCIRVNGPVPFLSSLFGSLQVQALGPRHNYSAYVCSPITRSSPTNHGTPPVQR